LRSPGAEGDGTSAAVPPTKKTWRTSLTGAYYVSHNFKSRGTTQYYWLHKPHHTKHSFYHLDIHFELKTSKIKKHVSLLIHSFICCHILELFLHFK
jgi:hypothetical protein